jgi:hypothetical protein
MIVKPHGENTSNPEVAAGRPGSGYSGKGFISVADTGRLSPAERRAGNEISSNVSELYQQR